MEWVRASKELITNRKRGGLSSDFLEKGDRIARVNTNKDNRAPCNRSPEFVNGLIMTELRTEMLNTKI
jgi:hypothetical protein